ncbi:MAG TPA: hypothetical protein VH083_21290 [Myxococcales bacterium]|jgi:hypothetical protein|nr:hypothetical protein [Myxococcales bacterium]
MEIPAAFRNDVDALPPLLRVLLDAELSAGNSVVGVSHGFPAPPVGCCVLLAKPVTTRARASGDGLVFRQVGGSDYSASFTDAKGYFYLLEPPLPESGAYPDMDAIREAHNAPRANVVVPTGSSLVDAFRASMQIDYEKWHDGIGYELKLLESASPAEKATIAAALVPPGGWRDVEALAALGTETAHAALRKAIHSSNAEVRTAVIRYSPESATKDERTDLLVRALQSSELYGGLTSALDQVAEHHPPRVVNALVRGLFSRPGEIACHFAAMLWFVHGKSDEIFDWKQRPLFLEFNSTDGAERVAAFAKLCALLEIDPAATRAAAGEYNEE